MFEIKYAQKIYSMGDDNLLYSHFFCGSNDFEITIICLFQLQEYYKNEVFSKF